MQGHDKILKLLLQTDPAHRQQGLELLGSLGAEGLQGYVEQSRAAGVFALLAADPPPALAAALPAALTASGQSGTSLLAESELRCRWPVQQLIHCGVFVTEAQAEAGDTAPDYPPGGHGYMLFYNEGWVYSRPLSDSDDLQALLDSPPWLQLENEIGLPADHPHLVGAPKKAAPPEAVDMMSRETDGGMAPDGLYDAQHQVVADYYDLDGYEADIYTHSTGAVDELTIHCPDRGHRFTARPGDALWCAVPQLLAAT